MSIVATLIRGGEVYAPEPLGRVDILTVGTLVAAVGRDLHLPTWAEGETLDASGLLVMPGLVDQHVHFAGGGGEGGFQFRTPELSLSDLTRYGITTAVGLLGTDGTTRSVQGLLAKARQLVHDGLNAWIYTGAYQVPTRTITDTPRNDIVLIDRVIGVGEIAISDHRGSHPSARELAELAGEARTGGLLAGKAGVLHLHVGNGPRRLAPLFEVLEMADVPIDTMVPTHLNRSRPLLNDAVRYGLMGGYVDITTSIAPDTHDVQAVAPHEAVHALRQAGVPLSQISLSTDAGGSAPVFDEKGHLLYLGVGQADTLFRTVVALHGDYGYDWSQALLPATQTPAKILKMPYVGRIAEGVRGDILVTDGHDIVSLVAGGRVVVRSGRVVKTGTFEPGEVGAR
ncbi:MAG: beta-aspartyl-peptidase [Firmicutes bacterium]|nr:beta-aspartyl-peptidase [Bacillota bacterium]